MANPRAPRQTPQVDPQHPQDHADDGVDRHRAVQEGDGPRIGRHGLHEPHDASWCSDLLASGLEVSHPLLEPRDTVQNATLLVLTANRGLCGGFNGNVRAGRLPSLDRAASRRCPNCRLEVVRQARHRGVQVPRHHGRRRPSRTSKTSRRSTKSTCSPAATSTNTPPASSIGSTSSTRSSKASPGSTSSVETLLPLGAIGGGGRRRPPRPATSRRRQPRDLRISAVAREHSGRSRADQLQDQTVQVLPRFGRQRADRPHGRHEERPPKTPAT